MSHYLIRYLDNKVKKKQIKVEASTKAQAIVNSRINPEQILSVSLLIHFGSTDLSLDIQELIISEIRALARSGQPVNKGMVNILRRSGLLKKINVEELNEGQTISKVLSSIGISKAIVAVVAAGEKSSRLDIALENSLGYIENKKEIQKKIKAPFIEGAIVISLAMIMIMVLPNMVAPALHTLTSGELNIETNFMTDVLIYIYENNLAIWIILLSFTALMFFARKTIWRFAAIVPGLIGLNEFFILKRSVLLLMILRPLFESGIPLNKTLTIIKSSMSSDTDVRAMNDLIGRMKAGDSLSRAVTNEKYWSPIFYNSFSSFEQAVLNSQLELIDTVVYALLSRLSIVTTRISNNALLFGKLLGFIALLMLVMGYYFPSLTANVS